MFDRIHRSISEAVSAEAEREFIQDAAETWPQPPHQEPFNRHAIALQALNEIGATINVPGIVDELAVALKPKYDVAKNVTEYSWRRKLPPAEPTDSTTIKKQSEPLMEVSAAKLWSIKLGLGSVAVPALTVVLYQRQNDTYIEAPRISVVEDRAILPENLPPTLDLINYKGGDQKRSLSLTFLEESTYSLKYKALPDKREYIPTMDKAEAEAYKELLDAFWPRRVVRHLTSWDDEDGEDDEAKFPYWETRAKRQQRELGEARKAARNAYVNASLKMQVLIEHYDSINPEDLSDGVHESTFNLAAIDALCEPPAERRYRRNRKGGYIGQHSQVVDTSSAPQTEVMRMLIGNSLEEQYMRLLELD